MSLLQEKIQIFREEFRVQIVDFGFPNRRAKIIKDFIRETPIGRIGVFVISHIGSSENQKFASMSIRIASRIESVQTMLEKTEIYAPETKDTWTYGLNISELRDDRRSLFDKFIKKYVKSYYDFDENFSDEEVVFLADLAIKHFEKFAWPFLKETSFTKERALAFNLRDDHLADTAFLTKSKKSITGLLLARELNRQDAIAKILKQTRQWFAKVDNEFDRQRFEKIVTQLGF